MNINEIAGHIVAIAKKMVPLIVPGATAAIDAAEALIELGEKVKPALQGNDAAELTATLDALSERVFAHADRTAGNLRK